MTDDDVRARLRALEKLFKAQKELDIERDRRYEQRFKSHEKADEIFDKSFEAWKERERNFLPKSLGILVMVLTIFIIIVQIFMLLRNP